ncbi:MAG: hypothetical protein CFH34_00830 [Alphaproteobacteria bacterium MarineAlpha9_Bin4]|nr:MAG: hypothetical protein CFH34_00830 [Alphaproteobacteria bacterium MarineAlpha9_Bin4]|tara:strand:- start:2734 stop:2907 length:174 start_codon:yes stop_codon:yes gene_type:complete
MEELEFIIDKDVKKTIENFSIEELINYKKDLLEYAVLVDDAIQKKLKQKKEADKFFK